MAKHFTLQIADGSFSYERNQAQIEQEALYDGIYVIRTAEPQQRIGSRAVVRAYKQLKVNERAFRTMKTPLEIRPIYHRLEDRVRAHAFICMLGCYVQFELAGRLAPLLFADDTPLSATDPVAPARRSPQAAAKAASGQTTDGQVVHSLPLDALAIRLPLRRVRKRVRRGGVRRPTCPRARGARCQRFLAWTARSSCPLFIDERPSIPSWRASL